MRWVIAYVTALMATSVVALPCWNGGLRDTLGRFVSVEQIHVIEYAGLGWVAAWCWVRRRVLARRSAMAIAGLIAGVGLADEGLQTLLPQRVFQWTDVWLNWLGSLLGVILSSAIAWVRR